MRNSVFADTSGWLPIHLANEPHHQAAVRAWSETLQRRAAVVTTNLVVAELHGLLARRRGPAFALQVVDLLHSDPTYEVRYVDRELEAEATDRWLRVFQDRRFSLTDSVSFEVMRREGIRSALAVDRHFAVAGFELLL